MISLRPKHNEHDHTRGGKDAIISLLEFGDYQCAHCGISYFVVKEMESIFKEKIRFSFRNFPLKELHPYAQIAAYAAESAAKQHKFWQMHDEIYEHQDQLSQEFLLAKATDLGLDIKQFIHDMQSEAVIQKIENDFESGVRSGVNGTPTFFVNNERFDGSAIDLLQVLKDELKL